MRLLILTQKINSDDDVLGFFHRWVEEFSKQVPTVTVICLELGPHCLPNNVRVFSLGKEKRRSRWRYLWRFYYLIFRERHAYDAVFIHMNHEYVLLGAPLWRLLSKPVALWYAHGRVGLTLRLAEKLVNRVFTSTASGFRVPSTKLRIVGQGIDTGHFIPPSVSPQNDQLKLITVGRISPVKDYDTLLDAAARLHCGGRLPVVTLVGAPITRDDEQYLQGIYQEVERRGLGGAVKLVGAVPNRLLVSHLQQSDLFVNTSYTGSLDKAALEAMACGVPVLTCNEGVAGVLSGYEDILIFKRGDGTDLASKVERLCSMPTEERRQLVSALRDMVVRDHNLPGLIKKIVADMSLIHA